MRQPVITHGPGGLAAQFLDLVKDFDLDAEFRIPGNAARTKTRTGS